MEWKDTKCMGVNCELKSKRNKNQPMKIIFYNITLYKFNFQSYLNLLIYLK